MSHRRRPAKAAPGLAEGEAGREGGQLGMKPGLEPPAGKGPQPPAARLTPAAALLQPVVAPQSLPLSQPASTSLITRTLKLLGVSDAALRMMQKVQAQLLCC